MTKSMFDGTKQSKVYQHWRSLIEPYLSAHYRNTIDSAGDISLGLALNISDYQLSKDVEINKRKIQLGLI